MHFFSPGRELHLDYVAEAIILIDGGSEEVIDVLFSNHSKHEAQTIDRIHIV